MKGFITSQIRSNKRPETNPFMFFALVFVIVRSFLPLQVLSQNKNTTEFDEISVFLIIQSIGGYELNAIYMDDKLYIPVTEVFSILKINHTASEGYDSISGFFIQENNPYLISRSDKFIRYSNNQISLRNNDIFKTDQGLYLNSDVFGKVFGLNLTFNFRSLSLELKTSHELPVIKELRLEQMRKNLNKLRGEVPADTTIKRNYHLFRGGMADWSVISSQATGGTTDTRVGIGLGAELLGGETNLLLNYSTKTGFDERQQQYRWRWANNDAGIVRQVIAGKILNRSISSIYAPIIGFSATNTPTTFRKSFGSYTLADFTEPGWTVELYINNVIVDFTTADASGFFKFDVPMVYGSSQLMLKYYGPWGEERVKEQTINLPYNFLPKGTMEYNISGGVVRDSSNSIFSRAETSVGINRSITVGGGIEYLSSVTTGKSIPFLNTSARFLGNFLFTGEYAYGVRARGLLSYRLPSNLTFELDYTNYKEGQKAISFNYLEERKASLSVPVRTGKLHSFVRAMYKQNVLSQLTYSTTELLLSTNYNRVSANISGYANWITEGNPYIYSNVALGFKLGRNTNFRPQAQIDLTNNKLISVKAEIEKSFSQKAFLSLVYEENIRSAYRSIEVSFRYDLPFAQTSTAARISGKNVLTTESARGSFAFGSGNGYIHADNRSTVGRGGITITPFLDINHNGKRDGNEPVAPGLNLRMNGGRILPYLDDSLIRIAELEPYTNYLLEFDDNGFENIAWQLKKKNLRVNIDPNQFKKIEIPITVMGEVNGTIVLNTGRQLRGQGRMLINIYDSTGQKIKSILSESDGYFNFLGLAPGKYTARIDSVQLSRLEITPDPAYSEFEIKPLSIGDIVDGVDFTLYYKNDLPADTLEMNNETGKVPDDEELAGAEIPTAKNTGFIAINQRREQTIDLVRLPELPIEVIDGNVTRQGGDYYVQAGAFIILENALALATNLCPLTKERCGIVEEGDFYKLRFGYFPDEESARKCALILSAEGYYVFIGLIKY